MKGKDLLVPSDNVEALAHLRCPGGTRVPELIALAQIICSWAYKRLLHLLTIHLKGSLNQVLDYLSREVLQVVEWSLNQRAKGVCNLKVLAAS